MGSRGSEIVGETASNDGGIDLPRLFSALRARKGWILLPTLAAFGLGLAFVTYVSPRYTATAKVLLENQESYFTRPEKAAPELTTPSMYDAEGVQSEAESIATEDLARKAVQKLGLAHNSEFNPASSRGPLSVLVSLFGGGHGERDGEDRAVETFLSRLTVFPVAKSRILQIEFVSTDPALAASGANTVAELYLTAKAEAKKNATKAAGAWLSGKIEELRGRVADADAKVETYRAQFGLLAGANGMTLPSQQLAEINAQIASARAAQSAATSKAQLLRQMLRQGRLDAVPDVAKDESLRRYSELRVTLKAQIAQEGRTLLPGHPRMQELSGQLAGLDAEMRDATARVVRGLEDEAQLAGSQVTSLEAAVAKQSQTVANSNVDEVRLHALELDAKTARAQLESYTEKYHEAIAHEADYAEPPDARVISTATAPRLPTFPKKGPTLLMSALAGLFLSIGVVVARALLVDAPEGSAKSDPALEATRLDEPEVAAAPTFEPRVETDRASVPTTALDAIVDRLAGASTPGSCMPILVAADGGEGALAVALSAARRLSKVGSAVLLDLAASQPWLSDVFDPAAETGDESFGLSDLLDGRAKFAEALHRDLSSSVDILPSGLGEIDPDALEPVFEVLRESYSFVVVHASDWRAPTAGAAIDVIAAAIICAPASRLDAAQDRFRRMLGDTAVVVAGLAIGAEDSRARSSRAAVAG